MGLWILEPKSGETVPGTVHLHREAEKRIRNTSKMKHGSGRHAGIVLAPQPSDSPNDPLNWSKGRKIYTSVFLSCGTGLMAGTHNFINPANAQLAKIFQTNISTISRSVSIILLALGLSAVLSSPAARIWGKRPVILIGNSLAILGYIVVVSKPGDIVTLYVGRTIHGLGISPLEYLVSSIVGDLFFVHERGVHLALWHYGLAGGNAIGQVFGTQILAAQGWVWPFIYTIIFLFIYTVFFFLTCPETTYNRPRQLEIDIEEEISEAGSLHGASGSTDGEPVTIATAPVTHSGKQPASEGLAEKASTQPGADLGMEAVRPVAESKKTYWQSLKVYNGRFSNESLLRSLVTPWTALLLPAVSWAAFSYGSSVAFAASFSVALGQIFTKPPYNLSSDQVGLAVLSAFVGTTLGNLIPGPACDWLAKYLSKKNKGVYEPEFRLVLSIPAFILGLMGFWGFGMSLEAGSTFMVPVFFYGLATFAGSINSLISNAYLLDCHRAQAQDGYAAVTIGRGVYSFAMTFVINGWIARDGYKVVYFWIGFLHGLSCLIGLVLYVFGKKIRLAISKWQFIQAKSASRARM